MNRERHVSSDRQDDAVRVLVTKSSVHMFESISRSALAALLAIGSTACEMPPRQSDPVADVVPYTGIVEAGCARCRFAADEPGCDLAIRMDGGTWLVSGTAIDDHGDAHAADGFCNATRQARVVGRFENERFVVDEFELVAARP